MSSAADQLEAFPFVRELTPLDFLHLPRGLFEALPKPCNMKRSAASAGPIWPPVLTNVLLNGLLILHHKPHLVGKPGLDEHYNWLSAFIYRQTRGWDTGALARNTIEIKPPLSGERQVGIIRNRKQISSKVQTIGEYLKDTHWAYVTQGPKPPKDAPLAAQRLGCDDLSLTAPIFGPPGSAGESSPISTQPPDLSQVSLEPTWLPPTPFSLPSTPNQSPFSYPSDVTDYEVYDARMLGYEPGLWREFADRLSTSRHPSAPLTLEVYSMAPYVQAPAFSGSFTLTSASISVHFGGNTPNTEGISPHLLSGFHQISSLDPTSTEGPDSIALTALDMNLQQIIRAFPAEVSTYYVDLPIHFPASIADRTYLSREVGCDYHVKARIGLSTDSLIPPIDDTLKAVTEVYFLSGFRKQNVEPLETYEEAAPVRCDKVGPAGALVAHTLAGSFAAKIWGDVIERPHGADPDLSRYLIVQRIVPRSTQSGGKPLLVIVYSPRLSNLAEAATMKLLIRDGEEISSNPRDSRSPTSETDMDMDSTPRANTDEPGNPGPSTGFSNNRATEHGNKEGSSGNFNGGKNLALHRPPSAGAAGPIRNMKAHARNQRSLTTRIGSTATTTPPPNMIKFPLTPNPSPGSLNVARHEDQVPMPDMSQISNYHPTTSTTPGLTAAPYLGDWTALLPSAVGSAVESVYATPRTEGWSYDSPELARLSVHPPMPTAHFDTYPFQVSQRLGYNDNNEHLLYYGTGVGSWN